MNSLVHDDDLMPLDESFIGENFEYLFDDRNSTELVFIYENGKWVPKDKTIEELDETDKFMLECMNGGEG